MDPKRTARLQVAPAAYTTDPDGTEKSRASAARHWPGRVHTAKLAGDMATSFDSVPAFLEKRRGGLRRLASALDDACEWGVISIARGEDGLTFVLPRDEEVDAILENFSAGEVDNGIKALEAYAVPLFIPDADTWRARVVRDNGVGTRAGFRLPDPAEHKKRRSRKTIELPTGEGSITLRVDSRFASKHRIAVWRQNDPDEGAATPWPTGGVPWSPPAVSTKRKEKRERRPGGRVDRPALIRGLGRRWSANMKATIAQGYLPTYARDPFLVAIVSLLDYLRERDPEAYRAILPLASPIPAITFCLAVGLRSEIVSDRTLRKWLLLPNPDESGVGRAYVAHLTTGLEEAGIEGGRTGSRLPLVCSREGQKELIEARAEVAAKAPASRQTALAQYLTATYKNLAASNALAGRAPVFPAATLKHLGAESHRGHVLALVDSFRYVVGVQIYDALTSSPHEAPREIRDLFDTTVVEHLAYDQKEATQILERSLVGLVPQNPADMRPAFRVLEFFTRTDAFVSFPTRDILDAVMAEEPLPEKTVEFLRLPRLPRSDEVAPHGYSVEWTFARLMAENVLRGMYRHGVRRAYGRSSSAASVGVPATGGSGEGGFPGEPPAAALYADAPASPEPKEAPPAPDEGGDTASDSPEPERRRRKHRHRRRHRRSPTPSDSGGSSSSSEGEATTGGAGKSSHRRHRG
jgi:hypothetical protein